MRLVLLAVAAILILTAVFTLKLSDKMADMEVYWQAAVRARTAEPLYRAEDGHFQFKYLPAFAVLAIPAGLLPLQTAKAVWFALSAGLLVAFIALSISLLPDQRRMTWSLIAIAFVVMGKFYGHELVLGQVNLLLGVLVVGAVALMRRGHEWTAGSVIAAAVIVKPYAVIFLPWLAARRRPASLVAVVMGLVFAVLLPAAIYGFDGNIELHRQWWRTVADSTAPNLLNNDNVSAAAMWAKWLGPGPTATWLALVTCALAVAFGVGAFLLRGSVYFPEALEMAFVLTLVPLLSPQGWDYVFVVATPAVLILANYAEHFAPLLRALVVITLLTIGLTLYDVMGRAAYARFMSLSIITVCFLVVLGLLTILRARKLA